MKSITCEVLHRGANPASGTAAGGGIQDGPLAFFLSGIPFRVERATGTILLGQYKHTPALSSIHLHLFEGGLESAQSVLLSLPPCHFNPLGQYLSCFILPAPVKQKHSRLIVDR